ncbi:Ig-like domain-containing protein, partial [Candidatus Thioglobus sp.]|nr:Ig-like domain-containing protein [Candidatus Thioglobus sp.]
MKTCSEKILIKLVFSFIFILCSSSVYSGVTFVDSFSVSSQETQPTGLAFNSNGTKMFVIGCSGDDVNEYTLSTGFDVSTASYDSNFSVRDQESTPTDLAFNSDGTKMFVIGSSDDVNEYTLSTGFDVSTASYDSDFKVESQESAPKGLAFNSDGTKMFVTGYHGDDVNEYTLSTGFNLVDDSTAPTTTFSPANSATAVAVASDITLTFNEAVRLINNSALDDSNVDALITLKEDNASGADIAFNA